VTVLRRAWEGWKRVARVIGDFQARLVLVVFYFVVFGPFALAVRLTGDPLAIKAASARGWLPRRDEAGSALERATRQS